MSARTATNGRHLAAGGSNAPIKINNSTVVAINIMNNITVAADNIMNNITIAVLMSLRR